MSILKKMIQVLSDEELAKGYEEISNWKYGSGALNEGVVRRFHTRLEENMKDEMDLRSTENAFFTEMCRRFYISADFNKRETTEQSGHRLNPLEELQCKYLTKKEDGEGIGFDEQVLKKYNCWNLHGDLVELFDKGHYYTNDSNVIETLKELLDQENIPYKMGNTNTYLYQYLLQINTEVLVKSLDPLYDVKHKKHPSDGPWDEKLI